MLKEPTLKVQAKAIFIGSLIGTIFQFMIPMVLVRIINADDFGVFRQFQLLGSTFLGFLVMGYSTSLFYFYPISDSLQKQKLIQQMEFLYILNATLFVIVFILFGDQILDALNFQEFSDIKLSIILYVTLMLLSTGLPTLFTVEKNILLNKVYPSLERIFSFLIFIIFIFLIPGKMGPIIALIVHAGMRLIFYFFHIRHYLKQIYKLDFLLLRKLLIYSWPFGLALILNLIATKFDKFFVNQYITPKEFGVYSLAFLGIPILGQFFSSIHNVVVPQISVYLNGGQNDNAVKLWQKTVEKTSNITIPAVFLFLILADEFITILYTKTYIEAANYYRIFVLSFFVSMFSYNIILRGANKTKYILLTDTIGTILTVIAGFLLIPKMGLYGAVLTALLGTILPMLISLHIERRYLKLSFKEWFNWKVMGSNFLICLLIALPLYGLKGHISNIFLRSVLVFVIFLTTVSVIQIKLNVFMFHEYLSSLNKPIIDKLIKKIKYFEI